MECLDVILLKNDEKWMWNWQLLGVFDTHLKGKMYLCKPICEK